MSLTGNKISSVSSDALSKLRHLRSIDLSNNRLHRIGPGTFDSQHQLRLLQLSGNPIDELAGDALRGLSALDVLSLAYVSSDHVGLDDDAFDHVQQVYLPLSNRVFTSSKYRAGSNVSLGLYRVLAHS